MTELAPPLVSTAAPGALLGRSLARRALLLSGSLLLGLTWSGAARAQADVNPPLPNVLFLVDTSGSMEYLSSSSSFPTCVPGNGALSEKSRWADLVEVMTGSVANYSCFAQDRSSTAFANEYNLVGGTPIYDYQYTNPYHRILSGTCTPGPNSAVLGALTSSPYSYPANWLKFHDYSNASSTCTNFTQAQDGLLDTFRGRVRFGLMTFDTHTDPGTGLSGSSANFSTGMNGTWSYFVGSSRAGRPAGCAVDFDQEVGARNAAAPPWEGRMVGFGAPTAGSVDANTRADRIQDILLSTRPYGATPIAGILADAHGYLYLDNSNDPLDNAERFGPAHDPYVSQGCRKNVVVLLTDGEPNLDLRPFCESGGSCPYARAEDIAQQLSDAGTPVFVVGFAVNQVTYGSSATPIDCSSLNLSTPASQTICADNPGDQALQVCCTLSRIAYNGGTERAFFPTDKDQLRQSLSNILSQLVPTTSRTLPVFAGTSNIRSAFAGSYRVHTSFTPKQFDLWSAVLERQRIVCEPPANPADPIEPVLQSIEANKGDDFVANVNSGVGTARQFFSVRGDVHSSTGSIQSEYSVRPRVLADDGAGVYGGTPYNGVAAAFVSNSVPDALDISAGDCVGLTNAAQCRDRVLNWTLGIDNGTVYSRCNSGGCNLVGDIYHSTPRVMGRPSEFVRDESYDAFAIEQDARPLVLYTSTNDGFLHAFDMNVDTLTNNELWAFAPPAVLTGLKTQYPGLHKQLLDGVPVIRDVVATVNGTTFDLERTAAEAQDGLGRWRTILLQSFGSSSTTGGYFAVDVTDPVPSTDGTKGPKFLWQLTKTSSGEALFGSSTPTPLIATLFIGTTSPKEVAVAVLPGGYGGQRIAPDCTRTISIPNTSFPQRSSVRCYSAEANAARSVTIVRLDTGEVIRSFRPAGLIPGTLSARTEEVDIQSPITGQPVAYPGDTGTIADRIFVGDADGGLWRINTSSTNPEDWTMDLFWDAYPTNLGFGSAAGQPIATPPVLSVDSIGQITVALSTGDQEVFNAGTQSNFVWSLTETVAADGSLGSKANWYTRFENGERVAGPISLFNGSLFFSTFQPETSTSQVCNTGNSRVWGVDYLIPKTATDPSDGGAPRIPEDPEATTPIFAQFISAATTSLIEQGATIFGVGVTQLPSCNEVDTGFADPYLGSGTHRSISNVNPGKFQLVMHTGTAGASTGGGKTNTLSFDLPSPPAIATIDSWAALVEGL